MISAAIFGPFYQDTVGALRKYVSRCLGRADLADDIVQEAYLRLLRQPPPIDDVRELRAYLFGIASNLMADQWRRRQVEATLPEAATPTEHDAGLQLDMQRHFLQLRPLDRQLLWLAYVEGASHREVAATLGLREGSVRVLLFRARERLVALLEPAPPPAQQRQVIRDSTSRWTIAGQLLRLRAR
jgi:RNA polymerase sigma-70 factor, ECF subfamily